MCVSASFDSALSAQTVQGCGMVNSPLVYPISQDGASVLDPGIAGGQWASEYSAYPMMPSDTSMY